MKAWLVSISMTILALIAPIKPTLIAAGAVIFIDLITGIWRAIKNNEKIQSSAMRRTVTKFLVYNTAIFTGFLLEIYLMNGIPVTKLISSTIGLVEAKSILENLNEIYGADIFKTLLNKLGSDNDTLP